MRGAHVEERSTHGVSTDRTFQLGAQSKHDRAHPVKIAVEDLSFWCGDKQVTLASREVPVMVGLRLFLADTC